jgi:hypothetical protein
MVEVEIILMGIKCLVLDIVIFLFIIVAHKIHQIKQIKKNMLYVNLVKK